MESNLSLVLLLILTKLVQSSSELCKNGHIAAGTSFRDEDFPSLAKIINVKTNGFICRAAIIRKHQFITSPCCVLDDNNVQRNVYDIAVVLQYLHQNKTTKLEVNEIFVHPESANSQAIETRFALVITETVPYEFFIFTSCLRDHVINTMHEKVHEIIDPCQLGRRVKRQSASNIWMQSQFTNGMGALYIVYHDEMFLFGTFHAEISGRSICKTRLSSHVADVYKYFKCDSHSPTTVIGSRSSEKFCRDELIFEDNFDVLDNSTKWRHEKSLAGGGNWEFQWFVSDTNNSFIRDGVLHLRPTLTADVFGEKFLTKGIAQIASNECTYKRVLHSQNFYGCERNGHYNLINPIRSASISTINSFSFKYGTVEVRAKMATGDWLTSSISLLPKKEVYGQWPASGQIDMAESRGNRQLREYDEHIGIESAACTLHFGRDAGSNKLAYNVIRNTLEGFGSDFHVYKLKWSPERIVMLVDDQVCFEEDADEGLWKKYQFTETPGGSSMAPFDKEFFISLSLKVGGVSHYSDSAKNEPYDKPWKNDSPHASQDFWNAKDDWIESWDGESSDFQIDYVRVYAE